MASKVALLAVPPKEGTSVISRAYVADVSLFAMVIMNMAIVMKVAMIMRKI